MPFWRWTAPYMLAQAEQSVRQYNFAHRVRDIATEQVMVLLHQGGHKAVATAAQLARAHDLPTGQARVYLAQGDPAKARWCWSDSASR